jgi:phosphoribosylformimino-5-aminoimidazole carboxamide ribonucleotide (ProFAR) isomerase
LHDLKADELVFLDIEASRNDRLISLDWVRAVGEEAFMPFNVGGGIRTLDDIRAVLAIGVCIDVKKRLFKDDRPWVMSGTASTRFPALEPGERRGVLINQPDAKELSF